MFKINFLVSATLILGFSGLQSMDVEKLEDSVIDAYLSGNIAQSSDCRDFCQDNGNDCFCFQVCVDTLRDRRDADLDSTANNEN